MPERFLNLELNVWRQKNAQDEGRFETYQAKHISTEMSFLEMLDIVNEDLVKGGQEPIAMDHDCREGICGTCGLVINGRPHGPKARSTTCQLHMRSFSDGDTITIEPFRAKAFPVIKDLMVDRSALERVIAAGGYISAPTGSPQDANALPVPKDCADLAMDAAACIGCGACVAACPNASAMLFLSAKVSQLGLLPQGQPERLARVRDMIAQLDTEGFGTCANFAECEAACPKGVQLEHIARMNRDFIKSGILHRPPHAASGGA
jgi:succinate dehydrogenase / fumarate reductase iron-sulfur subunit